VLDRIADQRKNFILDCSAVPFFDSTAANAMHRMAVKAKRKGVRLFITGASRTVRRELLKHGLRPPLAKYRDSISRAMSDIKAPPSVAPGATNVVALR